MSKKNTYQVSLPKGEATRALYLLNEDERRKVGMKIFELATALASEVGKLPVTSSTLGLHQTGK